MSRKIDNILISDSKRWKQVPESHPIFFKPDYRKFDYAMTFFLGLYTRKLHVYANIKDINLLQRSIITITTNKELFKTVIKKIRPKVSSYTCHSLDIRSHRVYNADYFLSEICAGIYTCIHYEKRCGILYAPDLQNIYDNMRVVIEFYANVIERCSFPMRDITDLSSALSAVQQTKDMLNTALVNYFAELRTYLSINKLNEFAESNSAFINKTLYEWLMNLRRELSSWTILITDYITFKYNNVITAKDQYVTDCTTEETVKLRYPYFIYDLSLRYKLDGNLERVEGKGYHPNRNSYYLPDTNKNISVCIGELRKRDINLQTLADNGEHTTIREYLIDVVNSLKTVNLASAYWQPSRDLFLERHQRSYKH